MNPNPPATVAHRWHAMATAFQAVLGGSDPEHLEAVASALEDECRRLEAVLSRFNPASEISRVNRDAALLPARVSVEVWELLIACEGYRRRTHGSFDVTAGFGWVFDHASRTVHFPAPGVRIDLGGIGKGYALDRLAELLRDYAVPTALLYAGTSSILAHGPTAWQVVITEPTGLPAGQVTLKANALSYSGARRPGQVVSDIIDPHRQTPITSNDACVVIADTATEAEALSTGLLAMSLGAAIRYLRETTWPGVRVGWVSPPTRLEWLSGAP